MIPLRLAAYGLAAAAVLGGVVWTYNRAFVQLPRTRVALIEANKTIEAEREARAKADDISRGYQDELERLRNRPVVHPPVRLCRNTATRMPETKPGPPAAGAGGGVGDGGAAEGVTEGPDIGPDLFALAARCDEVTAQLRGLQEFHRD